MRPEIGFSGRIYYEGRIVDATVEVVEGKIHRIRKVSDAEELRDFGDALIVPGGVDMHVHFRDPGMTGSEDFSTGSTAAIFGGITCVVDMPNTIPPVVDAEILRAKLRRISGRSWVDFGLAVMLTPERDPVESADLAAAYKLFMASTTGVSSVENTLHRAIGLPRCVIIHAEDPYMVRDSGKDLQEHDRVRPEEAEVSAIRKIIAMAEHRSPPPTMVSDETEAIVPDYWVHIAHLSSPRSVPLIENMKDRGFTSEATPSHLFLDREMDLDTLGKINPPLRSRRSRIALWEAFREGRIDVLASDHAPHTMDEKDMPFEEAPAGVPGVETSYPLMMLRAKRGEIPISRLVDAIAQRPAEVLGVRKGRISPGYDADLAIFEMSDIREIHGEDLHSKCGWTPFENFEAIFPHATVLKGEIVQKDGALYGDPAGEMIKILKRRSEIEMEQGL